MKLFLIKDWTYETHFLGKTLLETLYKSGHQFESNEDGLFEIKQPNGTTIQLTKEEMLEFDFIEEPVAKEEFEIIIEEISDDDDILVRNWRIQLDVKTTRKKLKEVQKIIEEQVKPIL